LFVTEFGRIDAEPGEIVVIPRGVKFRVELTGGRRAAISARIMAAPSRCRSAGRSAPIVLPMRATSSRRWRPMRTRTRRPMYVKWGGTLFKTMLPHSPIDVVAWHGNYAPYKYDLRTTSRRSGAIGFDHPIRRSSRC
jgi:homogentisate 1,2-dioxygenase